MTKTVCTSKSQRYSALKCNLWNWLKQVRLLIKQLEAHEFSIRWKLHSLPDILSLLDQAVLIIFFFFNERLISNRTILQKFHRIRQWKRAHFISGDTEACQTLSCYSPPPPPLFIAFYYKLHFHTSALHFINAPSINEFWIHFFFFVIKKFRLLF